MRASEAVKFEEKGERLFRLKDVVFESQEGPGARVVSVRAPRAELVEGSRAFRIFDDVKIEGDETSVSASSFRYEPALRVLASEGPVAALRAGLVAHAASGRVDVRDGHLVLDGDARCAGAGRAGAPSTSPPPTLRCTRGEDGSDGRRGREDRPLRSPK